MEKYNVAVVGATGAVGREMVSILEERDFPFANLRLLATERSAGTVMTCKGEEYVVEVTTPDSFEDIDIALFSAGSGASKKLAPEAVKRGAVVVDNSSAYRMDDEVPLVVPEVNPEDIFEHTGIIANPNCSTIQMVAALKPIYDQVGIKRLVISTYQAVSGTGKDAMDELEQQSKAVLNGEEANPEIYPHQIAFNVLPHIDIFFDDGYTKEEMKMVNETQKIMNDNNIKVTATAARVPIFNGHAESINIETNDRVTVKEAKELLANTPGVRVEDDPDKLKYPLQNQVTEIDDVLVGRIREDHSIDNGLNLWVVANNLRKGAALNTIQIAEKMIEEK
ncbi:aspartate-semialdehyde dehydrogenase [Halobacteroides halobius DSM 5150]|uniref:Aspartate-semialdehyde dehydrogenase n=1 Tax=Halobacteroides halobius (strain ATCC 35273 / DSM 5150 / MD-1) TaxID=748449 RepID=L0K823_HALHC|nr:aspartate-semialdehyde dehydrogenase [Halobacteroides halobius]AGB40695.1 aspartate-semialdehyde dehydrogenase [Halobacteroides halobius DSM 5150]